MLSCAPSYRKVVHPIVGMVLRHLGIVAGEGACVLARKALKFSAWSSRLSKPLNGSESISCERNWMTGGRPANAGESGALDSSWGRLRIAIITAKSALVEPDTQIRLFGKPKVAGKRRMGVAVARGATIDEAREKARNASAATNVSL